MIKEGGYNCQEANRLTIQRERRYIAEYMLQFFPEGNTALNVELGPLPDEVVSLYGERGAALRMRPWRRRIDGVAWRPDAYYLVEAKIRDPLEGLGRLQTYRDLARATPELPGYDGQPFVMRLVVPFSLAWIQEAARAAGIDMVEWMPAWIVDYFRGRQEYFTAEYRARRDEKARMRELFGLE